MMTDVQRLAELVKQAFDDTASDRRFCRGRTFELIERDTGGGPRHLFDVRARNDGKSLGWACYLAIAEFEIGAGAAVVCLFGLSDTVSEVYRVMEREMSRLEGYVSGGGRGVLPEPWNVSITEAGKEFLDRLSGYGELVPSDHIRQHRKYLDKQREVLFSGGFGFPDKPDMRPQSIAAAALGVSLVGSDGAEASEDKKYRQEWDADFAKLKKELDAQGGKRPDEPEALTGTFPALFGMPIRVDARVPPGEIRFERRPSPLGVAELEEALRRVGVRQDREGGLVELDPPRLQSCQCGAERVGHLAHSRWCPKWVP